MTATRTVSSGMLMMMMLLMPILMMVALQSRVAAIHNMITITAMEMVIVTVLMVV